MRRRHFRSIPGLGLAVVTIVWLPGTAHAYLDAGTGSMIIQVVIATIAGVAVTARLYWARIKAKLTNRPSGAVDQDRGNARSEEQ